MEGMASYMAKDETARDKMFLRDAVVNDRIPSVTQDDFGGFFAYRFGHAVFDFMEERWGKEGFLDFLYEFRNTIGARRRPRRRARLQAWSPRTSTPSSGAGCARSTCRELVETGEPSDFGRLFRVERAGGEPARSRPAASPSGDLVAAFSTYKRRHRRGALRRPRSGACCAT